MMNIVEAEIELRHRAIQLALNFAGRVISQSDGTYDLLITVAQDAMREWARSRVEKEREACARDADDEVLRARELQARRGDYGGDMFRAGITQGRAQAASLIAARIRARSEQQTMETKDDSRDF